MSRVLPEVFDSPCRAAAAKVQDFDAQEVGQYAVGHAQDEQGPARGLRLAVPGSGSEGAGLQRAGSRRHAVGHGQDEQGPARGLRLAVPGSGSQGAGLQRARPRQHAGAMPQ